MKQATNEFSKSILTACLLIMVLAVASGGVENGEQKGLKYVPFEFPAETYVQEFEITFKNEEAAKKATVEILPLYNGYEWAISSRWDDNNGHDIAMRDVLNKRGHKGTWYLNEVITPKKDLFDIHASTNATMYLDTAVMTKDDVLDKNGAIDENLYLIYTKSRLNSVYGEVLNFASTAKELLKGGHSIAGHSLTHGWMTSVNRNRLFEEIAGVRMEWEAAADTLVVSWGTPFDGFNNELEGKNVTQTDITRAAERAGYYHVASDWWHKDMLTDMIVSRLMPWDGKVWDGKTLEQYATEALKNEEFHKKHPNLSYAMHVWYQSPAEWSKFESELEEYGNNPKWWYCNQNEYAAYRYQYEHSKLSAAQRLGNTVKMKIERPVLTYLNDPTPLTFQVTGASGEDVVSVKCATADCAPPDRKTEQFAFYLYSDHQQKLPGKIGLVRNDDNHRGINKADFDKDFPGLMATLSFDKGQLCLALENQTAKPIKDVYVTFRLPLAWREGVVRHNINEIGAGKKIEEKFTPTIANSDYKYTAGINFFAAQIDFDMNGKAGRLHATCYYKNNAVDHSYPQGGFLKLGPVRRDMVNIEKLISDDNRLNMSSRPWLTSDGITLKWSLDSKDNPFEKPYIDVERIRTLGSIHAEEPTVIMMQTSLLSESNQAVKFVYEKKAIRYIILNGKTVSCDAGELRKGDNSLVLVYYNDFGGWMWSPENAGCFLRIINPETNERLKNIRFEPEKVKIDNSLAFQPPI